MYHIFCLTTTLDFMTLGVVNVLDHQSARPAGRSSRSWENLEVVGADRREHAVQRAAEHARLQRLDVLRLKVVVGAGAGGAQAGRGKMAAGDRRYLTERYGLTRPLRREHQSLGVPPGTAASDCRISSTEFFIRDTIQELVWAGAGDIEKFTGEICIRGPQGDERILAAARETPRCCRTAGSRPAMSAISTPRAMSHHRPQKRTCILGIGFNVYPNEIESVVRDAPGRARMRRGRRSDEKSGEAVKVVIVKRIRI